MADKKKKKKDNESSGNIPINDHGDGTSEPIESEPEEKKESVVERFRDRFDQMLDKITEPGIDEESADESEKSDEPVSAEEKLKEMTDNWQRERASFQNYKRRIEEERGEIRKYAIFDIALDLLKILDYFEASVSFSENLPDEAKNVVIGVKYTIDELVKVLESHHIVPIDAQVGKIYDPGTMEVTDRVEKQDTEPGVILEVARRGWKVYDRVLRSSQVVVSYNPDDEKVPDEEESENGNDGGDEEE